MLYLVLAAELGRVCHTCGINFEGVKGSRKTAVASCGRAGVPEESQGAIGESEVPLQQRLQHFGDASTVG